VLENSVRNKVIVMCEERAAVLFVCSTFFLGDNVDGSTFFLLGRFVLLFCSTKCCNFAQKASIYTPFFFFLKQISKAFLFSFLRERRKTFLAKVDFSEQRMLFEEESCWTRFRFHKSCFFNLIFSKERQHVCLNLLLFFF
jgi:hypothetical protein